MSDDENLVVMDESRGPKYGDELIRNMMVHELIPAIYEEREKAVRAFEYDSEHLSPAIIRQLEAVRTSLINMARMQIGDPDCHDFHALAWFHSPSYRHLCDECVKQGMDVPG